MESDHENSSAYTVSEEVHESWEEICVPNDLNDQFVYQMPDHIFGGNSRHQNQNLGHQNVNIKRKLIPTIRTNKVSPQNLYKNDTFNKRDKNYERLGTNI